MSDFLACLRRLASRCKFDAFLSEALRDRLVCGLNSESIQTVLVAKQELTLDSALNTALSMEAAAKKTKEMKVLDKSGQATGTVHKLSKHNKQGYVIALFLAFLSFVHVVAVESIVATSASSSMVH